MENRKRVLICLSFILLVAIHLSFAKRKIVSIKKNHAKPTEVPQ